MNYFATSSTLPQTVWASLSASTAVFGPDSDHDPVARQSCRDADLCSDQWIGMLEDENRRLRDRLGLSAVEDA